MATRYGVKHPSIYKTFYRGHDIGTIDLDAPIQPNSITDIKLFFKEKSALTKERYRLTIDLIDLRFIVENYDETHSRYKRRKLSLTQALKIKEEREADLHEIDSALQLADEAVYTYFFHKALACGLEEVTLFKAYYAYYYVIDQKHLIELDFWRQSEIAIAKAFENGMSADKAPVLDNILSSLKEKVTQTQQMSTGLSFTIQAPENVIRLCNESYNFQNIGDPCAAEVSNLIDLLQYYHDWQWQMRIESLKILLEKQACYL